MEKIPTCLHPIDEDSVAFAGLHEFWPDPEVADEEEGDSRPLLNGKTKSG